MHSPLPPTTQALGDAETITKSIDERSLYAAPFPFDASLDAIQDMFAGHGPVNCVRFRRHMASKDFKGSVFVEFTSKEAAEEVQGCAVCVETNVADMGVVCSQHVPKTGAGQDIAL